MEQPAVVWDPALLGYDLGGEHPFNPVRLQLTIRLATELGVLEGVPLLVPEPASDTELLRIHAGEYLEAVKQAPMAGWDVGHGLGTSDNPVFSGMHDASALVVGSTLLGARKIAEGEARRAVNIAGGLHHAMRDHAAGFCVYNDCAVAISWLLDHGFERIAYIDTDVHHGDGVQAAFYDDPRVLTVSLHQHPFTLWPGTGYSSETGNGAADGTAVNIPLPPRTHDPGWLRAFHAVVPSLVEAFEPQLLVTQCGVDSHEEDPLADLSLSVDGHRTIYTALRELAERYAGGKWLAVGGGGYQLIRVVPRSWTHLLATVLDRDVKPETPIPPGWADMVRKAAPRAELPTEMSDGADTAYRPWGDGDDDPVDIAIRDTRRAVFPLHGLDPDDPRD
ncbi:acetoin utilization protein AcuC [Amycolatopsis acidiphila]|uniref:Acetoin utilization protein AcuC n=1 Tax=Amycolatopsis acidiphila TaxID=715473 RepID=A0A557ZNQ8_9PSEU|nr:acetoin utilization protein AcuC [Amycolatopsis acidiphila]TVT13620.1 acetoin utilization protein AcuC [Amycolatopsis acidiphila]UIJ58304.1 acetoin utilization protein AcuC [Amycolatopsis acidiphila]GHG95711.1 acetoin utilization protein AcuC [Amycolatopsis acidiphila]